MPTWALSATISTHQHQVQLSSGNGIQLGQHQNRLAIFPLKTLLGKQLGNWHKTLTSEGMFHTSIWEAVDTQGSQKGGPTKKSAVGNWIILLSLLIFKVSEFQLRKSHYLTAFQQCHILYVPMWIHLFWQSINAHWHPSHPLVGSIFTESIHIYIFIYKSVQHQRLGSTCCDTDCKQWSHWRCWFI